MTEDTKDHAGLLQEARERFEHICEVDKDNRDCQRMDTRFVYSPGEQWPEDVKAQRGQWKELCLEFNQLKQFVAQVVNDQRQNRPGIRVHPADGEASKETAEIIQGLIRSIEYDSKAEAVYDNAFQNAVVGGRGWFRIRSEYVDDEGFDQKLVIDPIFDSNTVYADIDYQQPDGSDRKYVFVTETINRKEFARQYPDAEPLDWDGLDRHWANSTDDVIVADYYRRVCTVRTKVRMSDGAEGWKDEMPTPPEGVEIVTSREVEVYTVEWYKIAGGQQVLATYEWPGTMIPVICTTGDDIMMDGKRVYQGLTRHARDAQSMLNFGMTQQAIHLSLTPRAPWVATADQIEGYEEIWKDANIKNYSVLPYNHVDNVPPPQRTAPSMPDAGWGNWCNMMISMIRSTIGMYENSLGMRGTESSGKAIVAREKQGDNATFNYVDNLSRAIALAGRIICEVLGKYYDTKRIVHTVGLDGTREEVIINQVTADPDNPTQAIIDNDITTGKYSVTVEAGPSFATKRQESAETLSALVQAYPPLMQVAGDIVMRAQDIPDAEALAERLKMTLPPTVQQAIASKQKGGPQPDPQMLAELQQKDQQLQQAVQTMDAMHEKVQELESGTQAKMQQAEIEAQINVQKAAKEAEVAIEKARIDAQTKIEVALINKDADIEVAQIQAGLKMAATIHAAEIAREQAEHEPPDETKNTQPASAGIFSPEDKE